MIDVRTSGDRLEIRLRGTDALWALKRELQVPLGSIRDVAVASDVSLGLGLRRYVEGLRLPGTLVPGVIVAGSYWRGRGRWTFCCLRRGQRALVIDLIPGDGKYERIMLGVDDPGTIRDAIESARRARGG